MFNPIYQEHRQIEKTSEKYSFIDTQRVIDVFNDNGFFISDRKVSSVKKQEYAGYQKHQITFRHNNDKLRNFEVNNNIFEINLINSHLGNSSFQLIAGLNRLACLNGLMVSCATIQHQKINHIGFTGGKVNQAINQITTNQNNITDKVKQFEAIKLDRLNKITFASEALNILFNGKIPDKIEKDKTIDNLLIPVRNADRENNLFNVFNTIQEKFTKRSRFIVEKQYLTNGEFYGYNLPVSRQIKSIDKLKNVNVKLWDLMDKFNNYHQYTFDLN
jgi:hypothetical protein